MNLAGRLILSDTHKTTVVGENQKKKEPFVSFWIFFMNRRREKKRIVNITEYKFYLYVMFRQLKLRERDRGQGQEHHQLIVVEVSQLSQEHGNLLY